MAEQPIRKEDIIDAQGIIESIRKVVEILNGELSDALKNVTKQAQEYKNAAMNVNATTSEGQKVLASTGRSVAQLTEEQKQLVKISQELEKQKTTLNLLEKEGVQNKVRETAEIRKSIQEKKKEVVQGKAAADSYAAMVRKLRELREAWRLASEEGRKGLTPQIKKLDDELKRLDKTVGQHQRNVGNYSSAWAGVGRQMLSVLGLTGGFVMAFRKIGQVFGDARKDVIEFEAQLSNVMTLLDEVQKAQYREILNRGVIQLTSDYGFTIEETSKALFDYISATGDAAGAISFMNKAAKVAIGGNASLSSVIDGATNIMGAYGSAAGSAEEILNAFFAAQVKGKTTVELLASNIGKTASVAAAAGIPLNELFGTLAGLTRSMGGTEEAATVLTNTINALIAPSKEAEEIFASLGIETGVTAVKNEGLLNKLLQVAAAYEGNNDILVELIPNIRALRGVAALTTEEILRLEGDIAGLNDTQAASQLVQEAFNEQMGTTDRQAKLVKQSWSALMIEIGGGESIFKRVGSSFRQSLINTIEYATDKVHGLRRAWVWFTDIFRKEENKRLEGLLDDYYGVVEKQEQIQQDLTVSLTKEEEDRQQKLADIRAKAAVTDATEEAKRIQDEIDARIKAATAAREARSKEQQKSIADQARNATTEVGVAKVVSDQLVEIKRQEIEQTQEMIEANAAFEKEMRREILQDAIEQTGEVLEVVSQMATAMADIVLAQKQRELNAAGDNAQKREEIERKYFKREQTMAIGQAIINGALAITKVQAQTGVLAALLIPLIAASTAAQVALISAQKFAEGGFTGKGTYRDETGERVAGIVHENEFVINKENTKKYRPLIEAIHQDDPAKIAEVVANSKMHDLWGNMNQTVIFQQDPYTQKTYELLRNQPVIYINSSGDTVLRWPNGNSRVIKNMKN